MKSKENLLDLLKPLPHFSKDIVHQLSVQLGLKNATVDTYISRFLKHKELLQLKNGLYASADFFSKHKSDISYSFYLANIIRTPSYVSSWTALQYYNLTTEAIHGMISVTPKITRTYKTKAGIFVYQSMQKELFSNFVLIKGAPASPVRSSNGQAGGFNFFIATPSKALFDLLYFRTRQFRGFRLEEMKALVEDLRIDMGEMDTEEQVKFYAMMKDHFHHE